MVFKDKFPLEIEFEIDRNFLVRYYRLQALIGCAAIILPFATFFTFVFLSPFLVFLGELTPTQRLISTVCSAVGGLAVGLLVTMAFYYTYFHKSSELAARNLRLPVEGPYLRLVSGSYFVTDKRYHFKDVHTYTICQGPLLKWFGMKTLAFHVSSRQVPPVQVAGIIDVESVRDKLCEIDAAREHP